MELLNVSIIIGLVSEIHWRPMYSIHNWPVMRTFGVFFVPGVAKLLNTQSPLVWDAITVIWRQYDVKPEGLCHDI